MSQETNAPPEPQGVGICGAGERGVYVLGRRMEESFRENGLEIRGIFDRNSRRASESREYLAGIRSRPVESITVHPTLESMLADPSIAVVLITSYTAAHRAQTEAALAAGKPRQSSWASPGGTSRAGGPPGASSTRGRSVTFR